jgi:hypothetical protein
MHCLKRRISDAVYTRLRADTCKRSSKTAAPVMGL